MQLINATAEILKDDYDLMGKFSSLPVYHSLNKSQHWKLIKIGYDTPKLSGTINTSRKNTVRRKIKYYVFEYV